MALIKITILTVVFNRVDTILNALESVKNQIKNNFILEHIIIDGASTDGTLEILKNFPTEDLVLISEPDKGIYDALNKGLTLATGDIIGIMHSDDFYASNDVLQSVAAIFKGSNIDFLYGDIDYVDKKNEFKVIRSWRSGNFSSRKLYFGWMPPHPSVFFKKALISKLGHFNTHFKIAADYDFMLRYLGDDKLNIFYIPRTLVKMRIGGESNRSLKKLFIKASEDHLIIKDHRLGGFFTLIMKNISKIKQFF